MIPVKITDDGVRFMPPGGHEFVVPSAVMAAAITDTLPVVRWLLEAKYLMDADAGKALWRIVALMAEREFRRLGWPVSDEQVQSVGFLAMLESVWRVKCEQCGGSGFSELAGTEIQCSNCRGRGVAPTTTEQALTMLNVDANEYGAKWEPFISALRRQVINWEQEGLAHVTMLCSSKNVIN